MKSVQFSCKNKFVGEEANERIQEPTKNGS